MRVLNWISVQGLSLEQVYKKVDDELKSSNHLWFDDYIIGGGRWNTGVDLELCAKAKTKTKLPDNVTFDGDGKIHHNMLLNYNLRNEDFNTIIKDIQAARSMTMDNFKKRYPNLLETIPSDMEDYSNSNESNLYGNENEQNRYSMRHIMNIINGEWTEDSYFYDLKMKTSKMKFFQGRLNEVGADQEWLVPVDFHIREYR